MSRSRRLAFQGALIISALALSSCSTRIDSSEFARTNRAVPKEVAAPPGVSLQKCTSAEAAKIPDVASYPPSADPTARANSLKQIKDRGRLIAGVSADTLLFGFRNPQNGRLEGLDVDLIREVAKRIFNVNDQQVDDKIEFRVIQYRERIPLLVSEDIDLVAHTMTINCERWKTIAFSTEYYSAGQKLLVREDSKATALDKLGKSDTLCIPSGGTSKDTVDKIPGLRFIQVGDITECLLLMQEGKATATLTDDTVLAGFQKQDPYLKIVGEALSSEPYGLGMNAKNTDLTQLTNDVLETLRTNGGLKALYETHGLSEAAKQLPSANHSRPLPSP